jgi:hypothetical protein
MQDETIGGNVRLELPVRRMLWIGGCYISVDGWKVQREEDTLTPNGNKMCGSWVLRNADGEMLDYDQCRYDLESRCHLDLHT